ncbi:hypothetical protein JTB14_034971 [Gonioctena quinquepunctata]|nr:hypothetical protein JTB14_034971 [Gonioctena quinquepunctata]
MRHSQRRSFDRTPPQRSQICPGADRPRRGDSSLGLMDETRQMLGGCHGPNVSIMDDSLGIMRQSQMQSFDRTPSQRPQICPEAVRPRRGDSSLGIVDEGHMARQMMGAGHGERVHLTSFRIVETV